MEETKRVDRGNMKNKSNTFIDAGLFEIFFVGQSNFLMKELSENKTGWNRGKNLSHLNAILWLFSSTPIPATFIEQRHLKNNDIGWPTFQKGKLNSRI